MAFTLLTLRLHAPLPFEGVENPPFAGVPDSDQAARLCFLKEAEAGADSEGPSGLGPSGLAEGEEELFAFQEEALVVFDPDDGPRVGLPLPPPAFYGRSRHIGSSAPQSQADEVAGHGPRVHYALAPGAYLFMQFRPRDLEELRAGIEWFARESWWENAGARGPYLIRRVAEDGKLATQIIRSI